MVDGICWIFMGFFGKLLPTPVDIIEFSFARLDNQKRTIRKIMSLIKKQQLDKWLKTTSVSSFRFSNRFPSTKLKIDHTKRLNYQHS
jgi:hypothetical protein